MANKPKKAWRKYTAAERAARLAVLKANGGNLARTARETGVPRTTLQSWAAAGLDLATMDREPARPVCGLPELPAAGAASAPAALASAPKKASVSKPARYSRMRRSN